MHQLAFHLQWLLRFVPNIIVGIFVGQNFQTVDYLMQYLMNLSCSVNHFRGFFSSWCLLASYRKFVKDLVLWHTNSPRSHCFQLLEDWQMINCCLLCVAVLTTIRIIQKLLFVCFLWSGFYLMVRKFVLLMQSNPSPVPKLVMSIFG